MPYYSGVPSNSGNNAWEKIKGTIKWQASYVEMSYSFGVYATIASPTFDIPADINVNVSSKFVRNTYKVANVGGDYRIGLSNGDTNVNDRILEVTLKNGGSYEDTAPGTMTASKNRWYVQYSYMATGPVSYLYYFNVLYR